MAAMDETMDETMDDDDDDDDMSIDPDGDPEQEAALSLRLAELLRVDISPVECLNCIDDPDSERNRPACPCFATLHPFCDLFHTWLCHRLIDDGSHTCCLLPSEAIAGPEDEESDLKELVDKRRAAEEGSDNDSSSSESSSDSSIGDCPSIHTSETSSDTAEFVPPTDAEDPLGSQLCALAVTASDIVHALEKNVGDSAAQRSALHAKLELTREITSTGAPLAEAEILGWYTAEVGRRE